jgi:hypothetical protein
VCLEEQGNLVRRPRSGALGGGLFIVLLNGAIKKRDDIDPGTLERIRGLQAEVARGGAPRPRGGDRP